MRLMPRKWISLLVAALAVAAVAVGVASAGSNKGSALPTLDPTGPRYTTAGGAQALPTDRTIPHWHSQFTDPTNGHTYGYNMVGSADPRSANPGTTTIPTDITPLNLVFQANGGYPLNGSDVVAKTVASPIFQTADYSFTPQSGDQPTGGAGELSLGNTAVQYEDAIMRSQFNKQGTSYHLLLGQPTVDSAETISVPANHGSAFTNSRGVTYGLIDITWFASKIQNLLGKADETHLQIYLTNNVMLYFGSQCCVIGFHGASKASGAGGGSTHSNGNATVSTFVFAAYTAPATFNPSSSYYVKDIHALSHEVAEWGDDPFVNNYVNPWLTPTAPQYGCTNILETGDPVVGIGFTLPGNTYDTNAYSDTYWHPEDEVFLPWFAREAPNTTSQAVQGGTDGRYTFMGNLNPYAGFQAPATGC
jgi:hypothetical protein